MTEPTTEAGKRLIAEYLSDDPEDIDMPGWLESQVERIEAEARAATLDSVLKGLRSEDDSTQLRAIIVEVEAMRAAERMGRA